MLDHPELEALNPEIEKMPHRARMRIAVRAADSAVRSSEGIVDIQYRHLFREMLNAGWRAVNSGSGTLKISEDLNTEIGESLEPTEADGENTAYYLVRAFDELVPSGRDYQGLTADQLAYALEYLYNAEGANPRVPESDAAVLHKRLIEEEIL
ncbi:hypothetical protein [Salininema proteolyticum]|uniref:Uncharacterized protein n=1 Tax=Salininema proteolyticum TaxID=1607685 RepID=A0ABV8TT11_9ACTN